MFIKSASLIVSKQHHKHLKNNGQTPHRNFIFSTLDNNPNELSLLWPFIFGFYDC